MAEGLPHDIGAERAVLGAMLMHKDALSMGIQLLHVPISQASKIASGNQAYQEATRIFFDLRHQIIFDTITDLDSHATPIDLHTLTERLHATRQLETIGGVGYLYEIAGCVASTANIEFHAEIVRDRYIRRQLLMLCELGGESALQEEVSARDILSDFEQKLFTLSDQDYRRDFEHVQKSAQLVLDSIMANKNKKIALTGVPSGFEYLDKMTCGFQPQNLVILAARPSVGKTALALNFAENMALGVNERGPVPVGIFSMEMSREEIVRRLISSMAMVGWDRIRSGKLNSVSSEKLLNAADKLYNMAIYIDDTPGQTVQTVYGKARRLKSQVSDLGAIIIDYMQLMEGAARGRNASRQEEVSQISRGLKAMARELNVPVIALSQLSREVTKERREPRLSDLRESGAIEQDADIVMFIHRDIPKPAHGKDSAHEQEPEPENPLAKLIVGKHRNGPTGSVNLHFAKEYTRFVTAAPEGLEEMVPPDGWGAKDLDVYDDGGYDGDYDEVSDTPF